jgi:outer membrane protein
MYTIARAVTIALSFLAIGATGLQAQVLKIAYINSDVILQQAPGRLEAEAAVQKRLEPFSKRQTAMQDSLKLLDDAYRKDEPTLTPAAKTQRQQAFQAKAAAFEQELEKMREEAAKIRQELIDPITEALNKVLIDIRAEEGYALILDVASGGIVAADKNLDISDRVLQRLRTVAKPAAGTAPKPPAASTTGPTTNPAGVKPPGTKPPPMQR